MRMPRQPYGLLSNRVPTATKRTLKTVREDVRSSQSPYCRSTLSSPVTTAQGPYSSYTGMPKSLTSRISADARPSAHIRVAHAGSGPVTKAPLPLGLRLRPSQMSSSNGGSSFARYANRAHLSVATDAGMTSYIDGGHPSRPLRLIHAKGLRRTLIAELDDGYDNGSDYIPVFQ